MWCELHNSSPARIFHRSSVCARNHFISEKFEIVKYYILSWGPKINMMTWFTQPNEKQVSKIENSEVNIVQISHYEIKTTECNNTASE